MIGEDDDVEIRGNFVVLYILILCAQLCEMVVRCDCLYTCLSGLFLFCFADHGLLGQPDIHTVQTQTSMLNGHFCGDCAVQSERQDILSAHPHEEAAASAPGPPASTVYCRKRKPGLCESVTHSTTSLPIPPALSVFVG